MSVFPSWEVGNLFCLSRVESDTKNIVSYVKMLHTITRFFSELGIIYTFLEADLHYFRWHFFSHQNLYYLITNAVLLKSWGWDHLALNYHFSPMYFFFESSNTMFNFVNFTLISTLFVGARRGSLIVGSFNFFIQKQKNKFFFLKKSKIVWWETIVLTHSVSLPIYRQK